jgi:5-methylcytosine-specific restriction protein A
MAATYLVVDDDGETLDARYDVEGSDFIFHSRGGTKGNDEKNTDYTRALVLVIRRLLQQSIRIGGAWVDSAQVQSLPLQVRQILGPLDVGNADHLVSLMGTRMKDVRSDPESNARGGNSTKRIRIATSFEGQPEVFAGLLGGVPLKGDFRSRERLSVEVLNKATPDYIFDAAQRVLDGVRHPFGPSTDFDLIADDGRRLPPKAVFGVALSLALGGTPVEPKHFSGGEGSPCFRLLRAAGYPIIPKVEIAPSTEDLDDDPDYNEDYREGQARLATHRKRERARGLSMAKKAQFRKAHGRLLCQRCGVDPVAENGTEHAEASIEAHHATVQVADMGDDHRTKLADLVCLCANCHRLVHRLLKVGAQDLHSWKMPPNA